MRLTRRRIRNGSILAIAIAATWYAFSIVDLSLRTQQYYSGWLVAALIVFLLLFYVKKKLVVLPLGRNAIWAQWHYYAGLFAVAVFAIHVEFSIPAGNVERILAGLLVLVVGVGVGGAVINRVFARRLSFLDEEVMFERIPSQMAKLRDRLETELAESVAGAKSSTLSDYYDRTLAGYFAGVRDWRAHFFGSRRPHLARLNDLELHMRYLNEAEAAFAMRLSKYLEQKFMLDAHYVLQGTLKHWGLLHAPFGVALLLTVLVHIVLVYAFRGGL